ncbi:MULTISPECIES: lytic murein transglycosylase B [Legionella]|uniref:Membrane bound lytic murein transglycosylase n=1 Tax=Legionella maceachernii TaxID=466 RepID=A0A0W0W1R6_9GAMM|nr:lytic murein transglycosylase B [Legionella maceachernii]KTD25862.1 membrane bound lytic murein transglycosylase [Legionella maceachernii]SJZ47219.1 membrane-bound lytic murein transglycosylase B [Legionella maceachernii]SUP03932.1 Membrane-bound lytic murein transglycosylase B precursor [Legionella maceachernii]
MQRLITLCLSFLLLLSSSFLAQADTAFTQRKDVQRFINHMVKEYKFNRNELVAVMNSVQLQPQIIESMEKPFEKKTWDVYKQLFLTPERVQAGMEFWRTNSEALAKAEKKYGVPANIIVAIIGVETLYGKHQGNYRVLDALSTLAFNYPKRSAFFTKELSEFLLLCREHHVPPTQYLGSYAGAMGKPQFMPSSYRYYAANFTENGKIDLMNDDNAVIASVANYFHKHGWKMNQGIAQPAQVAGLSYKKINTSYKKAVYRVQQLEAAGIKPLTAAANTPSKVGLIELTTQTGMEFWLAYPNFYVITRYNSSPLYAMAVYLLSLQLKNQWAMNTVGKKYAYV